VTRILIVDHHAIHSAGRELYRAVASTALFEVKVLAPKVWQEYGVVNRFEAEKGELKVLSSPLLFGGKTHRNLYTRLGHELRTFHPDILLLNSEPEGFLALQGVLLCRFYAPNAALLFTTWRNLPYGTPGEPFPVKWPWLSSLIERVVLPRSAKGIAHSPSAPEIFAMRGFNRIVYIPPSIDLNRFDTRVRSDEARSTAYHSAPLRVGFVGRLVREKGIDILLKALHNFGSPVQLTIVGEGPEKPALLDLSESLGLADVCTFLPPVPQSAIPQVMSQLDVLVLPSRKRPGWKEQFGRVLIEAMASGAIVVGSDSGAIPHVIGEAGLIFPEGDSDELRTLLRKLASDRLFRKALSEAGIRRATDEYSLPVAVMRYSTLLRELKFKEEIRKIDKTPMQQTQA